MRLHPVLRVLILGLAGCAAASGASMSASKATSTEAPPVQLAMAFGVPGETFEFEFTLRSIPIGRAVVAVGEPGWIDGRRSLIVRARGQSAGLAALLAEMTWEQTSTLDLDHGYVIRSHEELTMVFAGERDHEENDIGDVQAHDVISAVGAVRAWKSLPAQRAEVAIRFGSSSIDGQFLDAGREFLAGPERPAVKYTGTFESEFHFTAWVSDDTARVPLRFECDTPLGTVTAELVDYRAPRG